MSMNLSILATITLVAASVVVSGCRERSDVSGVSLNNQTVTVSGEVFLSGPDGVRTPVDLEREGHEGAFSALESLIESGEPDTAHKMQGVAALRLELRSGETMDVEFGPRHVSIDGRYRVVDPDALRAALGAIEASASDSGASGEAESGGPG